MTKSLIAVFAVTALLGAAQAEAHLTSVVAAAAATESMPAVKHLVYQFGYNTKAASQGNGTGTTTIDFGGVAADGGLSVTATDNWWMSVHPKQSNTCEVYADGSVTCSKPPYSVSAIQIAVLPMLGRSYFSALSTSPTSTWKQTYKVRATFMPGASNGFAGQVYTWNCSASSTGKGTIQEQPPLILVQSTSQMNQQGGRGVTVNQQVSLAFDPRIQMPVLVNSVIRFVPQLSVSSYSIELKLIKT